MILTRFKTPQQNGYVVVIKRIRRALNTTKSKALAVFLSGSYSCKDFNNQAEAMQFFKENGFNASYDPYNLDADNDGIPCEALQNQYSYTSQCAANQSWVNGYVRKNGTKVRGHCRKKR